MYSIGKFSRMLGVTPQTLRNWEKNGRLTPEYVDKKTGYRYYTQDQYLNYIGSTESQKSVIGYCRVNSRKQREVLERQVESVKTYMIANGYDFDMITDIGSGINYNKTGLKKLLTLVMDKKVSRVVVLYKDRLARFGFELIEFICEQNNVELTVIDKTDKTDEEEIVEDLIQITTVFSAKLHGKRAKKTREMASELKQHDYND